MSTQSTALHCRYEYDPLDRLIRTSRAAEPSTQLFYNKNLLATEITGSIHHHLFRSENHVLAELRREHGICENTLIACDISRSALQIINPNINRSYSYTAYGYSPEKIKMLSLVGFNGERSDLLTGNYFLGNGYRIFSPSLMRFNKPDNLSPFGAGGINSYFYCKGDPINFSDPTGHFLHSLRKLLVSSSGNLLKKPQLTVSLDLTGGTIGGLSKYQNIKRISGGIYAADEAIIGGGKTLVINGHGREGGHLLSKNQIVEPRNVVSLLKKKGISVRDYNDVHLMICHSAEGGNSSLANYLNRKFGIPVTAYQGQVGTYYSPAQVVKNEAKKISWIYRSSLHVREATFVKSQQMDIRTSGSYISNNGQTQTLNYRPVRIS